MRFAPWMLDRSRLRTSGFVTSLTMAVGVAAVTIGTGGAPARAGSVIPDVPRTNPVSWTPRVVDDRVVREAGVRELRRVGRSMYAGGHFNKVLDSARTRSYPRRNLFSFNVNTGRVTRWAPAVSGVVHALEASPDGRYLYVGGKFGAFDGWSVNGLVKYDLVNRRVVRAFRFPVTVSNVTDLQLVRGRLFVAGTFPGGIVAVDPSTGDRTAYFRRTRAAGTESGWSTRIYRFAVNPAATKMVVIGSFTSIGGKARQQAAMLDLGRRATVARWYSRRWNLDCAAHYRWYTRDVDWSADGRRIAIVTSGSSFPGTRKLCTTASWWSATGGGRQQPLWVNHTGGDTIHSVAVTNRGVFVSGHIRWLNNPLGVNSRGAGAVSRRGLGSINLRTGKATRWNPTKSLEGGLGGFDLDFTSHGLWVGHFEEYLGKNRAGRPERHEGIGLLPY